MNAISDIVFNHHLNPADDFDQLTSQLVAAATSKKVDADDLKGRTGPAYSLLNSAELLARAIYAAEGLAGQIAGALDANPFATDAVLVGNHQVMANRVADRITQLEQAADAYKQVRAIRDTIRTQLTAGDSTDDVMATLDKLI